MSLTRRSALTTVLLAGTSAITPAALVRPAFSTETGRVLRRGLGSAPRTIDPHRADITQEGWIVVDLFDGLLSHDAEGQVRLGLAQSMDISADGLIYRFKLRETARFSDGSKVTADDVVFSFRRLADPKTLSPYAYFTWPIVNGQKITAGEVSPDKLGIVAETADTVVITLNSPTAYFPGQLYHPIMSIVSRANVDKHGDAFVNPTNMVCSGAYMLAETVPQTHYRLVRNPHYFDAAQVKIETVMHMVTESSDTEFKQFRASELDITFTLPVSLIDFAKKNLPEAFRPSDVFGTFQFWINVTNEPWKSSPALRKALALAADTVTLAEKVVGAGTRPAFTFVPPNSVKGYKSPLPVWASWTQEQRDAEAQKLLAEAGYGPGGKALPAPELLFSTNENNRRLAIAVAAMWKQKFGIAAILNNQEGRVVASMADAKSYKDFLFFGWSGDYLDPITFLKLLRSDVGKQNYAGYANAAFDAKLDAANRQIDPQRRLDLLAEAEAMALQDMPFVMAYHLTRRRLINPALKGFVPNPRDFYPSRYLEFAS